MIFNADHPMLSLAGLRANFMYLQAQDKKRAKEANDAYYAKEYVANAIWERSSKISGMPE